MTPFRVQCETCQTAFRVRDERVVGQVHACPKCGGMVLLAPPEGFHAEAEATDEEIAGMLAAEHSVPAMEATPQPSPAEARGRGVAIGVAAGGLMLLGAAAAILFALRSGNPTAVETPNESTPIAEIAPSDPRGATRTDLAKQTPEAVAHEPTELTGRVDQPNAELSPSEPISEEPPASAPLANRAPALPPSPIAPPAPTPTPIAAPTSEKASTTVAVDAAAEQAGTIDPLDFDPTSADLILTRGPRKTTPAPAPPQPSEAPGALLDQRIANEASRNEQQATEQAVDQRLAARAAGLKVWARYGKTGQTAPPLSAAEALGTVVPEIELEDWPLNRALDLFSNLAGAPITLPPTALRHAGVRADRRISVTGREQTLGELLNTALRPLSLECVDRGDKLVVARRGGDEQHTASYSVDDLADDNSEELIDLVRTALGLDRVGVEFNFSDGKLLLTAPRTDHYELLVLCEQLRKTRGLALRSKYPRELLADRPAIEQLAPQLDRQATFSFVRETPLRRLFEYWQAAFGATVLVDWAALADLDLTPATPVTAAARDTTWRAAFDSTLDSLGLTWRAVDVGVIVITTPAEARTMLDLSAYSEN